MSILSVQRTHTSRSLIAVASLLGMLIPSPALAGASGTSKLSGALRDLLGQPVSGATVVLRHLESEGTPLTASTDPGGSFKFEKLPYGHYQVTFEVAGKNYASNRVLTVPPRKKLKADFAVSPFLPEDASLGLKDGAVLPGTSLPVAGVARMQEKIGPSGLAWFTTGKGVAVLVASGAAIVAGLIALSGSDSPGYSPTPQR